MDQRVRRQNSHPIEEGAVANDSAAILGLLSECAELLSRYRNPRDAMLEIVCRIGPPLDADRLLYFARDPDEAFSQCTAAWGREGLPAFSPGPYRDEDFPEVIGPLSRGETYSEPLADKTGRNREVNEASGTTADLMVPVIVRGQLRGILSIDQCRGQASFTPRQADALRALAAMVGSAIGRFDAESIRSRQEQQQHQERETAITSAADLVRELLSSGDLDQAIERVLPIIGAMAVCQRVILLLRDNIDGRMCHRLAYEWLAAGQPSQATEDLSIIFDDDAPPGAISGLESGSPFWWRTAGKTDEFSLRHQALGVAVTGALPLLVEGRYAGTLAYDWCFEPDLGADGVEFRVLQLAANAVAAALQRQRATERKVEQERAIAASRVDYHQKLTAELSAVNDALAKSIEGLAKLDKLEPFLVELLQHASKASGAQGGAVVMLSSQGAVHLVIVGRERVLYREQLISEDMYLVPWDEGTDALIEMTGESDAPILLDPASPLSRPSFRRFHAAEGNQLVVMVPMRVGSRLVGWTGLGFPEPRIDPERDVHLLRVLSRQMTMAIEMVRLAESEREARVREERQRGELLRRTQIERAHEAMQAGVDALRSLADTDDYLGRVLVLAGNAFDAAAVWYFDVDPDEQVIRLRLWQAGGIVHPGGSTDPIPPALRDIHQRLVQGFTVATEHLGMDPFTRTRAVLIDHRTSAINADINRFVLALGAELELNVPVLVDGRPRGTLVVQRAAPATFALEDVALAEIICKQIAFSLRAGSIAGMEREEAVASDRLATLTRMAIDMRATNHFLGRSMARLSSLGDLDSFLRQMLLETIEVSGAVAGAVVLLDEEGAHHPIIVDERGEMDAATKHRDDVQFIPWCPPLEVLAAAIGKAETHYKIPTGHTGFPAFDRLHTRVGAESVVFLPLRISERLFGWIGLCFTPEKPLSEERAILLAVLAQQTALAVELDRLHVELGQAESRRLQERQERVRVEHRERARRALQQLVDNLDSLSDRDGAIGHAVEVSVEAFAASGCAYFQLQPGSRRIRLHSLYALGRMLLPEVEPLPADIASTLKSLREEGRDIPVSGSDPDLFDQTRPFMTVRQAGQDNPCPSQALSFLPDGIDLNIPVMVQGELAGVLGIYRAGTESFTSDDLSLAESIGKHLALALRAGAVAQRERLEAIELEQSRHARRRANQLEAANGVLRAINERLGEGGDPAAALQAILEQATRALGAGVGAMIQTSGDQQHLLAHVGPLPGDPSHVSGSPDLVCQEDRSGVSWRLVSDDDQGGDVAWRQVGVVHVLEAEIFDGDRTAGLLKFGFRVAPEHRESIEWLAEAICQQSALAMRLASLSSELEGRARSETLLAERSRMAREIHDGVAQGFAGILMQLGALSENELDPVRTREAARRASDLARQGLADARRAVLALQPEDRPREDLVTALSHLVEASGVPGKVTCQFRWQGQGFDTYLGPARAHELFRVVQEALNNALRHASASSIEVSLERFGEGIRLLVEDDGVGFNEGASDGFGIGNMRARVQAMGGQLRIESVPGSGTRLLVGMPLLD